jgi:hypothetical protein
MVAAQELPLALSISFVFEEETGEGGLGRSEGKSATMDLEGCAIALLAFVEPLSYEAAEQESRDSEACSVSLSLRRRSTSSG